MYIYVECFPVSTIISKDMILLKFVVAYCFYEVIQCLALYVEYRKNDGKLHPSDRAPVWTLCLA